MFEIDNKKVIMGEQWVHIGFRERSGPSADAIYDEEDKLYWDSFPVLYNVDGGDIYDLDSKLFYEFYDIDPVDVVNFTVSDW